MTWKPYLDDRVIKDCGSYFIIKPAESSRTITPINCPVCDYLFRTLEDEKSYRQFECCESCELLWARPNQDKWKSGWRPGKELVQSKNQKKKLNISIEI